MKPWFSNEKVNVVRRVGPLKIRFRWTKADGRMGRFGGGWNWALGFRLGSTTLLLNLLVFSLSFSWVGTERPDTGAARGPGEGSSRRGSSPT